MEPGYLKRLRRLFMNANDREEPGPEDSPFNGVATLRFDTMSVSLKTTTAAHEKRQNLLPVAMTVMRIHRPATWFMLAAHPCAVFHRKDRPVTDIEKDLQESEEDLELPLAERRFDHLYHFDTSYGTRKQTQEGQEDNNEDRRTRDTSYLGANGMFMRRDYSELAHFMVVRDLTRRFRQVTFCMDGEKTAYRSVAAVFADDMRKPPGPLARRYASE